MILITCVRHWDTVLENGATFLLQALISHVQELNHRAKYQGLSAFGKSTTGKRSAIETDALTNILSAGKY